MQADVTSEKMTHSYFAEPNVAAFRAKVLHAVQRELA